MSQTSMINSLRTDAGIPSTEFNDSTLIGWLESAVKQHNSKYALGSVPSVEEPAIVYLAWARCCIARASAATKYYSVSGEEGSTNKAQIVDNNLSLIPILREHYEKFSEQLGISPAPMVLVSDLTKFDTSMHAITPMSAHGAPTTPVIKIDSYSGTTADISWNTAVENDSFYRYRLYFGTVAGLVDMTTVSEDSPTYLGVDSVKATLLSTLDNIYHTSVRVNDLVVTEDYYFVMVIEDINGRFSVSNEVVVGPTAAISVDADLHYMTFILSGELLPNTDYVLDVSLSGRALIEQMTLQASTGPSGGSFSLGMHTAAGGGGRSIVASIADGQTYGALEDQTFYLEASEAFWLRTGSSINGTTTVTVTIGYDKIAGAPQTVYNAEQDKYFYVVSVGPPGAESLKLVEIPT